MGKYNLVTSTYTATQGQCDSVEFDHRKKTQLNTVSCVSIHPCELFHIVITNVHVFIGLNVTDPHNGA